METHPEMFAPYERLIEIEILGRIRSVPENNSILRCLQFLQMDNISNADLCWNGDCLNCKVWIERNGKEKAVMSCRTTVAEGMKIVRISPDLPFSISAP
jgi:NADH dehydrogenase/NADH:ubiquinone oxidoreductase subunit G